jgi:hypothetical protein
MVLVAQAMRDRGTKAGTTQAAIPGENAGIRCVPTNPILARLPTASERHSNRLLTPLARGLLVVISLRSNHKAKYSSIF